MLSRSRARRREEWEEKRNVVEHLLVNIGGAIAVLYIVLWIGIILARNEQVQSSMECSTGLAVKVILYQDDPLFNWKKELQLTSVKSGTPQTVAIAHEGSELFDDFGPIMDCEGNVTSLMVRLHGQEVYTAYNISIDNRVRSVQ